MGSPSPPCNPSLRSSLIWFGSIHRTELIIPSSCVFAMFTRETFRSSTLRISKCSTNRNRKRRGKIQFPSSNHQGKSILKKPQPSNSRTPCWCIEILWNLDFGTWNFPTNRKIPRGWTACVSCSKPSGR